MDPKMPSTIGRYELTRLLGRGAMGTVYLGKDPQLDRLVAIKTLRESSLDPREKEAYLLRFRNEARAAARLSHPSIVAVYDAGEHEEFGPYLVFEYVRGSTLKEKIRGNSQLSFADRFSMLQQIAEALDYAHARSVIHRDVKPDNILVADDGTAKLADFGIARLPDASLTKEGQFLGTPCYAAPETISQGQYGKESDLYSFAAVAYELLSGTRAFPGQDALAVAQAVLTVVPPNPSEVAKTELPASLDAAIMRGLSKKPNERYENCSTYIDQLLEIAAASGIVSREQVRPRALAPSSKEGSPILAYGLAGAMALAVLAMAGYWLRDFQAQADEISSDAAVDAGSERPTKRTRVEPSTNTQDLPATPDAEAANEEIATQNIAAATNDNDPYAQLSRMEREDRAKDALDEARAFLRDGNLAEAQTALARAKRLDPQNSDIEEIESRINP